MKLEIQDFDVILNGVNTLASAMGTAMLTTAYYAPETLDSVVGASVIGTVMIITGLGFSLLGGVQ